MDIFDENFVSPRTIPWLYKLIAETGVEVTIKRCHGHEDFVDVTVSKEGIFGGGKITYSATIKDKINTIHPFVNQHNICMSIVRQMEAWENENRVRSTEVQTIAKREHELVTEEKSSL
jgi:hypothetical protein